MRVSVAAEVDAPAGTVWADIADLRSHAEWMGDAAAIEILSTETSGVGAVMRVPTRVGPLTTEDWIIVTAWDEGSVIGVVHIGAVEGAGTISVEPLGPVRSLVRWDETLVLPWHLGGRIGEAVAKPIIAAIWRANLERLASRFHDRRPGGSGPELVE